MKKKKNSNNSEQKTTSSLTLFFLFLIYFVAIIILFNNKYFKTYNNSFQILSYLIITSTVFLIIYQLFTSKISKKGMRIIKFILLIFIIFIYILSFRPNHLESGDDAVFIMNAQSLIQYGYPRLLSFPNKPYSVSLHNFGLTLLIVPCILIFGVNILALQIEILIFTIGFIIFFYLTFKKYLGDELSLLLTAIIAIHPHTIQFSYQIMTEIPYLFFTFLSFYLWDIFRNRDIKERKKEIRNNIILNVLVFFTTLIRKAGFIYIVVIPFIQFIKKNYKIFIVSLITLFAILSIYFSYQYKLRSLNKQIMSKNQTIDLRVNRSIYDEFIYLLKHSVKKIVPIIKNTPLVYTQKLLGNPFDVHNRKMNIIHYIILILLITGVIKSLKEELKIFDLHFIFIFFTLILFSHFDSIVYARHTTIIFPLLYFYLIKGIDFFLLRLNINYKNKKTFKVIILSILFFINLNSISSSIAMAKYGYAPDFQNFITACKWIKENTLPDDTIASRKGSLAYIWAGSRISIHYYSKKGGTSRYTKWTKELEDNTLKMYYDENVKYLILDSFSADAYYKIIPIIKHHPKCFKVIYRIGNKKFTYILEINKEELLKEINKKR